MNKTIFEFIHRNGKDTRAFKIIRTNHLYDTRYNQKYSRDHFISEKIYKDIFKKCISNGLTSFRNKGDFVVSAKTEDDLKTYSFLCVLDIDNQIVVKTVLHGYTLHYTDFVKVKNRIFLKDYKIPNLTAKELKDKMLDNIAYDIKDENSRFLESMYSNNIRKLK